MYIYNTWLHAIVPTVCTLILIDVTLTTKYDTTIPRGLVMFQTLYICSATIDIQIATISRYWYIYDCSSSVACIMMISTVRTTTLLKSHTGNKP